MQKLIQTGAAVGSRLVAWVDEHTFGSLTILHHTYKNFLTVRAPEAAASIAYYSLFSLFPLLLSLAAIGGFLLGRQQFYSQVVEFVKIVFPVSSDLILDNVDQVLQERSQIGTIGLIGLIWSASAAFTTLFRTINRAWLHAKPLSLLRSRLVALGAVFGLGLLLVVTLFASAVVNLFPLIGIPLGANGSLYDTPLWILLSGFVPWFFSFLIFISLYRWIPNTVVLWREALSGALLVAFGLELTTAAFTWFLGSGLITYRMVYGSLGAILALLTWIYLNSLLIIFGAHLSAAIAQVKRHVPVAPADDDF